VAPTRNRVGATAYCKEATVEKDLVEEQLKALREEIASVQREVQTVRRLCERILATEELLGAEVRQAADLPPESEARGDEAPLSALFPGAERR
jgi:hypothetical protein